MNKFFNRLARPLCWLRWHPFRSQAGEGRVRCDVCGKFVKGGV